MPNVTVPNFKFLSVGEEFHGVWKLTRAMKAAGWRYKSSSDASAKETTGNPNNDKWGGGVQVGSQTATGSFNVGTPTSTKEMGTVTVSGGTMAGFSSTGGLSKSGPIGRFLKITGATNSANNGTWQIVKVNSSTSVDVVNPDAVAESTPGGATWTELDALLDAYPSAIQASSGTGAWMCMQGPSMMKIPIGTGTPAGTFVRGENVTQATTGATGEIQGVVLDTSGGLGFVVINPRKSGTGASPRGWNSSDVISAASAPTGSGATVTPTGTPLEFVQEIVFWKGNTPNFGHIYLQCIDSVNEGTATSTNGRFSDLATQAGTTATICPAGATGGNPTSNGFPTTGTLVWLGTGGSGAAATGQEEWRGNSTVGPTLLTTCHLMVANTIESENQSGDGTFTMATGSSGALNFGSYIGFSYLRMNDQEDGDVWPHVLYQAVQSDNYTNSTRTVATSTNGNTASIVADFFRGNFAAVVSYTPYRGWRRRGFSSGDAFQQFQGAVLGAFNSNTLVGTLNPQTPDGVACTFMPKLCREPVWVVSTQTGQKMRKGTPRWWFTVMGGSAGALYDDGRYVQLSIDVNGPLVVGPWDGTSTAYNS